MTIQEYVVREHGGGWCVWLGDRLLSRHASQRQALIMGHAFANQAAASGQQATLRLESSAGLTVEFPIFWAPNHPAGATE